LNTHILEFPSLAVPGSMQAKLLEARALLCTHRVL